MKDKNINMKAEDILTNEELANGIRDGMEPKSQHFSADFILASNIYTAIKKHKKNLTPKEKELIGKKIAKSIATYQRRNLVLRISAAAIFLVLVGISSLIIINPGPSIKAFAESNRITPTGEFTRLILSGKEEIQINAEDSKIEYAKDGNTIEIGLTEKITQEIKNTELVINTVIVPYGKRTKVTLSDNSTIWLNSGSKLVFPARFQKEKREVYLEGEAIFEVSHNPKHPFYVVTRNLDVKVLGTVFNVSAYADDALTSTVLVSGSVELQYPGRALLGKSKVVMSPNMIATYNPETRTIEQTTINPGLYTSWRDGFLIFERHPLGEIIKKISRYYNVSVKLNDPALADETFSGNLDLRNSAPQVLEIIAEIIDANIETHENQLIITKK